ncbi:hypothetical protein PCANB_000062 [Pneumocystis canis]|nr:hypothetical protein PCANB_000062 [Pneumocystis canis]
MSRSRHYAAHLESSEEMRVWVKIVQNLEHFEKQQEQKDLYEKELKKAQEEVEAGISWYAYQTIIDTISAQQNLLFQTQESLDILIALRQATEVEKSLQDSKRRKRKVDEQVINPSVSRMKKLRNQATRETFQVGSQVAFRQPKTKNNQRDWIQCIITRIIGEGPKARYEVQDPEPDEHHHSGQTYRTSVSNLILIPNSSVGLRPLSPGRHVLARYPETTTFYNAQVISTKRDGTCKLRFEGEVGKETEVERKLVLELT